MKHLLVIIAVCLLAVVALADSTDVYNFIGDSTSCFIGDSTSCFIGDSTRCIYLSGAYINPFWLKTYPQIVTNWKDSITIVNTKGESLFIYLKDTARVSGNLPYDSAAAVFFDVVKMVWQKQYYREWEHIYYMQEEIDKYSAQLSAQYHEVMRLWLQQQGIIKLDDK